MLGIFAGLGGKIAGALAVLAGVLGLGFMVRRDGVQAQQNADLKDREKKRGQADEIEAGVAKLDDAAVDDSMRQFTRGKP